MRQLVSVVMVTVLVLVLAVAGARAEEIQGKIQKVDMAERTIVLDDGTELWVAEGVPMEKATEGAAVKASYEERDGKKVATTLEVAE
jgi:hypothetical protein